MNNHVMLDIETLGNRSTSLVTSIGAVRFWPHVGTPMELFYVEFDAAGLALQQRMGMTTDPATILWWMQQDTAARLTVSNPRHVNDPVTALEDLRVFINKVPDTCVWGNGAAFDNTILGNMYDAFSLPRAWSHKYDRCYRTMRYLEDAPEQKPYGTLHNALDDAIRQAKHLQEIFTWLHRLSLASLAEHELEKTRLRA